MVKALYEDLQVIIAFLVYIAASLSDYVLTAFGLFRNEIREMNFIIVHFIDKYGINKGILLPKFFLTFSIILTVTLYLNHKYKRKETRIRPEYILYPGAFLTFMSGFSWLIHKYIRIMFL